MSILAVGDDDQSIYSWRMAHPAGILEFPERFGTGNDYTLSESFRCGSEIIRVARNLIESMPGRASRPSLEAASENPPGVIQYLRFRDDQQEQRGVAALVAYLMQVEEVPPAEVVVLLRGDFNFWWSDPLRTALEQYEIPSVDVEKALKPLGEDSARRLIALGRLASNRDDDLAWWELLDLTSGIADSYIHALYADAISAKHRFHERVERIPEHRPTGASTSSHSRAVKLVSETLLTLSSLDVEAAPASEIGWAEWLLSAGGDLGIVVSDEFASLASNVGSLTPQELGLPHFLNQLEPVAKDQALSTDGVPIMTMARAKGLTFRAAIIMGVEEGVVPYPGADENEERRLLYVALTRAREFVYLTMARRRTGPTARSGQANVGSSRSRSPLMKMSDLEPIDGAAYIRRLVEKTSQEKT